MRASAPGALWRALLAATLVPLAVLLAAGPADPRPAAAAALALLLGAVAAHRRQERDNAARRRQAVVALAHSVRTPLTLIEAYTETLLLGRERSAEERSRWLHLIGREAQRLGALADNLVLVAGGPAPGLFPVRRPVDLGALAEDVAAEHAPAAAARGARIVVDADAGVQVLADARALARAVGNLVDNAVRHGPEGQTIRVSLRAAGGAATLAVADGGPGIPAADRQRVWEPFVQLGGGQEGAGIGLAVTRQIVRAHGGRALLRTAPGGGACFVLELPVLPAPERAAGPAPPRPAATGASR